MLSGLVDGSGKPLIDSRYRDGFAVPHVLTFASIIGSGYAYYHQNWDEAQRHSREDALAMRRDCFLMGLMQERKLAVASLPWHLEVPNERDPIQSLIRDQMTEVIKRIRGLKRIIWSLLDALWFGRYAVQLLWRWEDYYGRRVLGVQKWLPHNGDKIGHLYDGTPYVLVNNARDDQFANAEFVTTTYFRGLVLKGTWRERFLLHTHEVDDADFLDADQGERVHGVGVRDRVFFLDWIRKEWLGKICDFIDRVGLGVNIWYYTEGNADEQKLAEKAATEQSDRVNIVWPRSPTGKGSGAGFERQEVPVTGAEFLLRLQEHVEKQIERYIVGQTLSSKSEGSGLGGSGVADLHADTKQKIAAFDAGLLGETLTGSVDEPGLVNTIQKWSFPEATFPVSLVFDVEKAESKPKLEAAKSVWEMGVSIKADEVRAAAGLSKPTDGDEVVEAKPEPVSPFGADPNAPPGQEAPPQPGQPADEPGALERARPASPEYREPKEPVPHERLADDLEQYLRAGLASVPIRYERPPEPVRQKRPKVIVHNHPAAITIGSPSVPVTVMPSAAAVHVDPTPVTVMPSAAAVHVDPTPISVLPSPVAVNAIAGKVSVEATVKIPAMVESIERHPIGKQVGPIKEITYRQAEE